MRCAYEVVQTICWDKAGPQESAQKNEAERSLWRAAFGGGGGAAVDLKRMALGCGRTRPLHLLRKRVDGQIVGR